MLQGIQVQQQTGELMSTLQRWLGFSADKLVNLSRRSVSHLPFRCVHDVFLHLGIIMGAAAFGLWWHSMGAGLFAGVTLFFLAGIYSSMRRVAAIPRSDHDRIVATNSQRNASPIEAFTGREIELLTQAIDRLQPWVSDETTLTEEHAKACCSILLETVATLRPQLARKHAMIATR